MRRIVLILLLGLAPVLAATPAQASTITFEFVCVSPADCDGDAGFSLMIMLDSSVVVPGGSYLATAANSVGPNPGFVGWSATSNVGNGSATNGFSISGTFAQIQDLTDPNGANPPPPGILFTFDNLGALSTIAGLYENSASAGDGIVFKFANQVCSSCYGQGGYISWLEPNVIDARVDGYTGGSIGRTIDDTNIAGVWRRVAVPEPTSLALLGLGLLGIGLKGRRRT